MHSCRNKLFTFVGNQLKMKLFINTATNFWRNIYNEIFDSTLVSLLALHSFIIGLNKNILQYLSIVESQAISSFPLTFHLMWNFCWLRVSLSLKSFHNINSGCLERNKFDENTSNIKLKTLLFENFSRIQFCRNIIENENIREKVFASKDSIRGLTKTKWEIFIHVRANM